MKPVHHFCYTLQTRKSTDSEPAQLAYTVYECEAHATPSSLVSLTSLHLTVKVEGVADNSQSLLHFIFSDRLVFPRANHCLTRGESKVKLRGDKIMIIT
jgi:hypothetical protein